VEVQERLETEISEAETRLTALTLQGSTSALLGNGGADARAEAANLREQIAERRAELRTVERDFRRDIDALNANLQFWTIGLPPALIILAGIAGSLFRRRRRA
jgi:ABC-2 type transport system permease protein